MNEQPTPRRSRVTVVKGASVPPVTLSPLIKGMVTGTLGNVPLTSDVYAQIEQSNCDEPIAWAWHDGFEVLGLSDGRVVRGEAHHHSAAGLPQLILTDAAR